VVHAEPYNGAAPTALCGRLLAALRYAAGRDTAVVALTGGRVAWSNGIHLGSSRPPRTRAPRPGPTSSAWTTWRNSSSACRAGAARRQTTITVLGASAGAGGAVLSACCDIVLARPSINLNYHYGNMGLSGSELRSLVLPLRAGRDTAERLLAERMPTSPVGARELGLVDAIGPDDPAAFDHWARQVAQRVAANPPRPPRPIDTAPHRRRELEDMRRDIFEDRHGFQAKRRRFLGLGAR
jgi:putative two-component system protein, hydrogenase maturation factor HypX/HoxX